LPYRAAAAVEEVQEQVQSDHGNSHTELSHMERNCCSENFKFYDKAKQGFVERFELPMVLNSK